MDIAQTLYLSDPVVFAEWVRNVAAVNEQFSEVMRDAADLLATVDQPTARGLYQASDAASKTVQALRASTPVRPPRRPKPTFRSWIVFGGLCALVGHWL
jgi:hypothetical protein